MELLQGLALVSGVALGTFIVGCVVLQFWLRNTGRPLLLMQALRRQGAGAAQRAEESGQGYSVAMQRCLACTEATRCQAWLWGGARDGYQSFCPNAAFIERMKR